MKRREFIKYGTGGLAALVLGTTPLPMIFRNYETQAADVPVDLSIVEVIKEMVDLTRVYHYAFSTPSLGPRIPGPVIFATTGDLVTINLTNTLNEPHGFAIPGVINIPPLGPGQSTSFSFTAPAAGTYLYLDQVRAPVNRVLGLHGVLIVRPNLGAGINTPYSAPTPNVQALFNDLGGSQDGRLFPGDPWSPNPASPNNRERIWLFSSIDPRFNALARLDQPIDPVAFRQNFLPRFFTINGDSGAFASHNPENTPSGRIGQPHLVRILNAGMATHSAHLHANHIYILSVNNVVQRNVFLVDTFPIRPLDRVDWLLPFIRPPDIPGDPNTPLRDLIPNELALTLGGVPQSPLKWPMHCHMEMSQTAAGGNYPQGLVTSWTITGDLDGVPFP